MSHRTKMMSAARSLRQNLRVDIGIEGPYQWGTVASITAGTPSTLGVYLDSASGSPLATISAGIPYINTYSPTVGDVVLIARMAGAARTQRIVLGPLGSSPHGMTLAGALFATSGKFSAGLTATTGAFSGAVTVPDDNFTMRSLKTTSGTDIGIAAGTWTSFSTAATWANFGGAAPTVPISPAVISKVIVWWSVDSHTGGAAGASNQFRVSLDGASFGQAKGFKNPVSGYDETVSGVDVFTGVSAAAHTLQMQVQTPAGAGTLVADGGLTMFALAIP